MCLSRRLPDVKAAAIAAGLSNHGVERPLRDGHPLGGLGGLTLGFGPCQSDSLDLGPIGPSGVLAEARPAERTVSQSSRAVARLWRSGILSIATRVAGKWREPAV